jgi:hypothetical protein
LQPVWRFPICRALTMEDMMQPTLAFAPTPEDLEDDLFSPPVLTFAPPPKPPSDDEDEG